MVAASYWGREFDDVEAAGDEARDPRELVTEFARGLADAQWSTALASLECLRNRQPELEPHARELAACVRLMRDGELLAALVRMSLSAHAPFDDLDHDLPNAVAATLADRLRDDGENDDWATLARAQHDDGEDPRVAAALEQISQRTPGQAGTTEALEDLLFDLASNSEDPGWYALSAWVASRQTEPQFEDETILEFARAALRLGPEVALGHALWVHVLLNLGDEPGANEAFRAAVATHEADPRWVWALLRAAAVDSELPEACDVAHACVSRGFEADPRLVQAIQAIQAIQAHREAVVVTGQRRESVPRVPMSRADNKQLAVSAIRTLAEIATGGGVVGVAQLGLSDGAEARAAAKIGTTVAGYREGRRWIGLGTIGFFAILYVVFRLLIF